MSYIVVKLAKNETAWSLNRFDEARQRATAYDVTTALYPFEGMTTANQELRESHLERQNYFIVKTKEDAEALAEFLTSKTPGLSWAIAKLEAKFYCPPGKITKSEYTEKGVLPV